jgi:hypothetical protein
MLQKKRAPRAPVFHGVVPNNSFRIDEGTTGTDRRNVLVRAMASLAVLPLTDAGFDPVIVGPLPSAKNFDAGTKVFGRALTARELRELLVAPRPSRPSCMTLF